MQWSSDGVILNTMARPSYRSRELGSGASGNISEITSADRAGGTAGIYFRGVKRTAKPEAIKKV